MEVFEAIAARTSVRKFKSDSVPAEKIDRMLEAAVRAPTAGNIQPWFFYVIKDEKMRNALMGAALGQKFIAEAPVVIVVCVDPEASAKVYGERGRNLYCLQDAAAAIQNMMLAAVSQGLGTCWVGAFDENKVADLLGLPPGRRPLALVPVGYPKETKKSVARKPLQEVVAYL